uniref:Uncharacterized protein n=1 Tax=Oryza punctata TaxID=4537 RepID=A0A0E0KYB1_ORYPU
MVEGAVERWLAKAGEGSRSSVTTADGMKRVRSPFYPQSSSPSPLLFSLSTMLVTGRSPSPQPCRQNPRATGFASSR